MYTGVAQGLRYTYFFDTKDRTNLELYFSIKNKHGYKSDPSENRLLAQELANDIGNFDVIYYPESANDFVKLIAERCATTAIMIPKNSKQFIYDDLFDMFLMKDEKTAFNEAFDDMGDSFRMHLIKANQRWRFEKNLFQNVDHHEGRVALLDDSVFSGFTLKAAYDKVPDFVEKIAIFSK